MNKELDDPRSDEYTFYRWNPFAEHWEFWDKITQCWWNSIGYMNRGIDFELPKGFMEIFYEDSWAEPYYGDMYA